MQTLVFNTTTKNARLYTDKDADSELLYEFTDVPTIKVTEHSYEVIQIDSSSTEGKRVPVARFPISNTNMLIKK
jgi:hypothetical protein